MKTQYMPRGSDLVASAFRRLDEQVAYLRRQVALSSLWSWNYQARLPSVAVQADPVERKRSRWELAVALVLACLALCACGGEVPEARELSRAEIEALFPEGQPMQFTISYVWEQEGTGKLVIVGKRETQ